MEADAQYFHISPELRQIMLLNSKQLPNFLPGGENLHPALTDAYHSASPEVPFSPPPPLPGMIRPPFSHGRWPRQETLTLLEIRARLDSRFRQGSQKAPLWDEVARIMADEYGYYRSGQKCKEKLDNLNKYYKKTKEGKIGKQDGKRYRFFRQLETLYGSPSNPSGDSSGVFSGAQAIKAAPFDGISDFSTSTESSGEEDEQRCRGRVISEVVEAQIKRLMEVQEAWVEKMVKCFERAEEARLRREECWRREEAAREERLLKALEKVASQRGVVRSPPPEEEEEKMVCCPEKDRDILG